MPQEIFEIVPIGVISPPLHWRKRGTFPRILRPNVALRGNRGCALGERRLREAESALVQRAQSGDRDAFCALVHQHQERLLRSVFAIAASHADAEDIVQDAFVRAYTKLESFNRDSSFYTWLYRIARNVALTQRRRRRPISSLERTLEETTWRPVDEGPSPTSRAEQQESVEQLRTALLQLRGDYRQILELREIEGLDYASIAMMLEINIGTVRSRLHRARIELSDLLKSLVEAGEQERAMV